MGKYKELIAEKTEGVLETVTDLVLVSIFFGLEFGRKPTITAADRAPRHLEGINYQTIKKTMSNLLARRLVERKNERLVLTEAGREKIGETILLEKEMDRKEGEVYLIIYDIANDEVNLRNQLRRYLLRSKLAKVQESVYLSPFDPRKILEDFLKGSKISGQILMTKLGKDSIIGGEEINGFLSKIYRLSELKKEYQEFIEQYKREGGRGAVFAFNRIYKKDPCLPEEFLPKDWIGAEAMNIYQEILNRESSRIRS